jgi:hypothetical protein
MWERPRTSGRRTKPTPRGDASSLAPSPIEWTVSARVSPRHTLSCDAGSCPASISLQHKASTGADPSAVVPSAEQRFEPTSVALNGTCLDFWEWLVSETTCGSSSSLSEALCATAAPGLFAFTAVLPVAGAVVHDDEVRCCCERLSSRPQKE